MFCQSCGTKNPDGVRYCAGCGRPMLYPGNTATPAQMQTDVPRVPNITPQMRQKWKADVDAGVCRVFSSPLMLVAILFFTIAQALNVLSLTDKSEAMLLVEQYIGNLAGGADDLILLVQLVSLLPGLLMALALWLIWIGGQNPSGKSLQSTGLTIIYVIEVISCVLINMMFVLLLLSLVGAISAVNRFVGSSDGASVLLLLMFVVGIFALVNLYYFKIFSTISRVQNTLRKSTPDSGISGFVGVMCIVFGALSLLSGLFNGDWVALAQSVANILFGSLIFVYKGTMEQLERARRMDVFGAAPYQYPMW